VATAADEFKIPLPALIRRAGLPEIFFQQEKIYATTAPSFHKPLDGLGCGAGSGFPTAISRTPSSLARLLLRCYLS
jgi:hypothetical protein